MEPTQWAVDVLCTCPLRKRRIGTVVALSEDQALMLAEKMAVKLFGDKGEGWIGLEVYMPNAT
jgi:hypothetical protein